MYSTYVVYYAYYYYIIIIIYSITLRVPKLNITAIRDGDNAHNVVMIHIIIGIYINIVGKVFCDSI